MKKILITAANSAKAYQLAHFLNKEEIIFADSKNQDFLVPDENRSSYAHELLSLCLDNQIQEVYPLKTKEIKALAEAKVLFKEYDIEVCISNLLNLHKINNLKDTGFYAAADYSVASSYQELSSKLLSLGYPNKNFVLGRLDDEGNLLTLNDSQSNFNSVWPGLKEVSFLQIGKLFNYKDFEPIKIYEQTESLLKIDFLVRENQIFFVQQVKSHVSEIVHSLINQFNLDGFFEIIISGEKVLRIKCNAI